MDSKRHEPERPAHGTAWARPKGVRLALEPAGRIFLPLFVIGALLGWATGGVGLLFAGFGTSVLLVAVLCALRQTSNLELRVLPTSAHSVGESFLFQVEARLDRRAGQVRDLYLSLGEVRRSRPRLLAPGARPIGGIAELVAGSPAVVDCGHRHMQRGWTRRLSLDVHSSHPFGLWRVERKVELDVDWLAWPRLGRLRRKPRHLARRELPDDRQRRSPHEDEDFYQLRPWRAGMSLRAVHWKLSARRGYPLIQEFTGDVDTSVKIGLLATTSKRSGLGRGESHSFESAVCLVATLLKHHLDRGASVTLGLHGSENGDQWHAGLRGRRGLFRGLDALALVEAEVVPVDDLMPQLAATLERSPDETLVFAGGALAGFESKHAFDPMRVIDVDAADIDDLFGRSGMAISEALRA